MWKVYRYNAWLERRSLRQFALVMAGINLAAVIIVLTVGWQIVPYAWIPKPAWVWVVFYAPGWTVLMTAWQTWRWRKQSGS